MRQNIIRCLIGIQICLTLNQQFYHIFYGEYVKVFFINEADEIVCIRTYSLEAKGQHFIGRKPVLIEPCCLLFI